jgi:hypothetical protein
MYNLFLAFFNTFIFVFLPSYVGLSAFSFGEEDVDRHVVLFKMEFTPSNDELNAYRKGLTWNPDKPEADNASRQSKINDWKM